MSFIGKSIGRILRPIIERKVRNEMCKEKAEVINAEGLEGNRGGGSTGAETPGKLNRVSNQSTGQFTD